MRRCHLQEQHVVNDVAQVKNDVSFFILCMHVVTDAAIGVAWGQPFSGQYSRVIKRANVKDERSFLVEHQGLKKKKTALNAKRESHHAADIRQTMKKCKSITLKLGTAALQDVPGRALFTAWRGRELEQR